MNRRSFFKALIGGSSAIALHPIISWIRDGLSSIIYVGGPFTEIPSGWQVSQWDRKVIFNDRFRPNCKFWIAEWNQIHKEDNHRSDAVEYILGGNHV